MQLSIFWGPPFNLFGYSGFQNSYHPNTRIQCQNHHRTNKKIDEVKFCKIENLKYDSGYYLNCFYPDCHYHEGEADYKIDHILFINSNKSTQYCSIEDTYKQNLKCITAQFKNEANLISHFTSKVIFKHFVSTISNYPLHFFILKI